MQVLCHPLAFVNLCDHHQGIVHSSLAQHTFMYIILDQIKDHFDFKYKFKNQSKFIEVLLGMAQKCLLRIEGIRQAAMTILVREPTSQLIYRCIFFPKNIFD